MKTLQPKKIDIDFEKIKKKQPSKNDMGLIVDEPCTVLNSEGEPIIYYSFIPPSLLKDLRKAVKTTKYAVTHRANGLPTKSSVFGSLPRVTIRCDYCRVARHSIDEKENFKAILNFREYIDGIYQEVFPENYSSALSEIKGSVNEDWQVGDSPYLTANINVNFAIPYHKDTGNMPKALSNVTIVREGVTGGELVAPEYGLSLSQRDGALCFFYGQSIAHGVMPFEKTHASGYRASIVYYTLQGMKNCLSKKGELERAQKERTRKELTPSDERRENLAKFFKKRN